MRGILPLLGLIGAGGALVAISRRESAGDGSSTTPPTGGGTLPASSSAPQASSSPGLPSSAGGPKPPTGGYPATVIPPQSVLARIATAVTTQDPSVMRVEAGKLEQEGWVVQARDLRNAASILESLQGPKPVQAQAPAPASTVPASYPAPSSSGTHVLSLPSSVALETTAIVASGGTLKQGSKGAPVVELQQRLNSQGEKLKADGNFGALTTAAVQRFQKRNGLKADGVVGPQTWSVLVATTTPTPTEAPSSLPMPGAGTVAVPSSSGGVAIDRPTLKQGSKGAFVLELQTRLNARGANLTIDGNFGPKTTQAVRSFQQTTGLKADGVVGKATWAALLATTAGVAGDDGVSVTRPTLRPGDTGPAVLELQQRLNARGEKLRPDGVFGAVTSKAVRRFQSAMGLTVDGIVGPRVWLALVGASDDAEPTGDRRALQVAAAAMLLNVKHKPRGSEKAIKRFQRRAGLPPTGLYDVPTAFAVLPLGLVPEPPTAFGSTRERLKWAQAMLQRAKRDPQRRDEWQRAAAAA